MPLLVDWWIASRLASQQAYPGCYDVVYEYEQEEVGLAAGRLALQVLGALLPEHLRSDRDGALYR